MATRTTPAMIRVRANDSTAESVAETQRGFRLSLPNAPAL
jgi:hypothetical protein